MNTVCSWSGGKDCCFALMHAMDLGYAPKVLLTVLNEEGKISRSHGIPYSILQTQANESDMFLHCISSSWQEYELRFTNELKELKKGFGLTHAVFGDIDLEEHLEWEERVCQQAELTAVLPLWKRDRKQLVLQMLASGIKAMIVSCNDSMGAQFIGKIITPELINDLDEMGIDPCGEQGEYHTLVLDCPLFSSPVPANITAKVRNDNYWFAQFD